MALPSENNNSKSDTGCTLPDPTICRVCRAEVTGFFYCLTEKSAGCQHLEAHGDKNFCFHPDPSQLKS